ncbi:MAG: cytochrome c3 family protein [Bacteroidota bacterium]|nr:cytochrome c3 family protein [Bacteroidota bacterium]
MKSSLYISTLFITFLIIGISGNVYAQLSPGELSAKHAEFEGLSNCTQCHSIGSGVPDTKCLDCHKEIKLLKTQNRGYHASSEAKNKKCVECHSDHHGRNFDMAKFNEKTFNHSLAGYKLEGSHTKVNCKDCHKSEFIKDAKLSKRSRTFLGLSQKCIICHVDYHQGTLKENCAACHNLIKFRPAPKFNHDAASFKLIGAHKKISCIACHKVIKQNGKDFQQFTELKHANCIDCHRDIHDGKFGINCMKCHNENSFRELKQTSGFNHNQTRFPLTGMHTDLQCRQCHKSNSYTKTIKFNSCTDCHSDYHKGEFKRKGKIMDCKECHLLTQKFNITSYTAGQHNSGKFPLQGAHLATPCISCHKYKGGWKFAGIATMCTDCHTNPHDNQMSKTYYEDSKCMNCHNENNWNEINFDHKKTKYELEGKHKQATCRTCHYPISKQENKVTQKFNSLTNDCSICHQNVHGNQFVINNKTDCKRCHGKSTAWEANLFDHNKTRFPLDGKHQQLPCKSCHKNKADTGNSVLIEYKLNKLSCIDCHS